MINKEEYLNYLYNRLPAVYREEDSKIGLPLYRYLQSLCEGGYSKVIDDNNNFLTLIDPEKCPDSFFPYLYASFGLKYYNNIDIKYHRKFLSNVGALLKRRGTKTVVRYIVATLTGYEVDLFYERVYNGEGKCTGRILNINVHVQSVDEYLSFNSGDIIEGFLKSQLPFYITPVLNVVLDTVELRGVNYTGGVSSQSADVDMNI